MDGPDPVLADFLNRNGIGFNDPIYGVATGHTQNVRSLIQTNNTDGAVAVQVEVARIRASQSVHGCIAIQNVPPRMSNSAGRSRNLDIRYRTRNFLYRAMPRRRN